MALIKSVRGFTPQIGENCYLADNATIIGDVIMGHDCSIWFNAVLQSCPIITSPMMVALSAK